MSQEGHSLFNKYLDSLDRKIPWSEVKEAMTDSMKKFLNLAAKENE